MYWIHKGDPKDSRAGNKRPVLFPELERKLIELIKTKKDEIFMIKKRKINKWIRNIASEELQKLSVYKQNQKFSYTWCTGF